MLIRLPRLPIASRLALRVALGTCMTLGAVRPGAAQTAPAAVEPTPAIAPASASEASAITQWVGELDNDRFAVREAAQQHLLGAGTGALDFVGRAAASGSLESSTRAVGILLSWGQSGDNALSLGALEQLAALTNRPTESAMANERLASLRETAAMEALVKMGGRVEFDRQIQAFTGPMPPLQVIVGPSWKGGVEGLEQVVAIRRATTVSFYSAPFDGDRVIAELANLPQIQKVEFYGTAISDEARIRLRSALPHLLIDVRGGARLGIAGPALPGAMNGATVGEVQPGTAAEKAGLQMGDVIVEIGGVAVKDFDALTKEIAKAKPDDIVPLKVLRPSQPLGQPQPQAKPLEITVKFEPWNDVQAVNPNAPSPLGGVPMGMPTGVFINRR
jgi:hypothetical protein